MPFTYSLSFNRSFTFQFFKEYFSLYFPHFILFSLVKTAKFIACLLKKYQEHLCNICDFAALFEFLIFLFTQFFIFILMVVFFFYIFLRLLKRTIYAPVAYHFEKFSILRPAIFQISAHIKHWAA